MTRLVRSLRLWGLLLIALHVAAPLLPEQLAWGVWPATYLPAGWRWGLALAAAGLVLWGDTLWQRTRPAFARILALLRWRGWVFPLLVAALSLIPFYLFRIRHLRWGDAYILSRAIPHPDVQLTYVWQAPLDVYLHARLWQFANRQWGWPDPIPVYWIVSALCGAVFVWVVLRLAATLGRDRTERLMVAGLVLTLGTMQLFFGYIENYTIMAVGVMIFLWLGLRALRDGLPLVWPATALAVTHAFHPSTIILAPGLLYLAYLLFRQRQASPGRLLVSMAVPYVIVLAGVVALMTAGQHGLDALMGVDAPGGGDRRWLVPLFAVTTRWEHYTMFSLGHALDIINQQLLSAPAVWPALLLVAVFGWRALPREDGTFRWLMMLALLYLLLTLVWNPDYGGQRDWDLFSPAALPASVLLAYALGRALPDRAALRAAAWALIPAQAFHTLAWVYQNTLPYAV
jgi:hypothetical protein